MPAVRTMALLGGYNLPDSQICKFVKAYAHNPVNLDAVAASSSASSEATDGPTGV
jgi:hypothetical protein